MGEKFKKGWVTHVHEASACRKTFEAKGVPVGAGVEVLRDLFDRPDGAPGALRLCVRYLEFFEYDHEVFRFLTEQTDLAEAKEK